MSLLTLVVILFGIGIGLYFLRRVTFLDPTIKTIIVWVVVIVAILLVLNAFGIIDRIRGVPVPKI